MSILSFILAKLSSCSFFNSGRYRKPGASSALFITTNCCRDRSRQFVGNFWFNCRL